MTLRLMKPGMAPLRNSLALLDRKASQQVVERIRGANLQRLRARVIARAGWHCECERCRAGLPMRLTATTWELDHILPLYQGGTNAVDNLRALHVDCHKRVTAQQAAERARSSNRVDADALDQQPPPHRRRDGDDEMAC
jgi:5-methylcytosine-specific restriction endonuclease McrA